MKLGKILVVIGFVFLFKNIADLFGYDWSLVWPIVLIAVGVSMMTSGACRDGVCHWSCFSCASCAECGDTRKKINNHP